MKIKKHISINVKMLDTILNFLILVIVWEEKSESRSISLILL